MLYCNLIVPHLFYRILLWIYSTSRLLKLQKKTIRTITCSRYIAHTDPIFKQLTFLKFNDIHQLQQPKFMYKLQNHTLPLYFNTFLPKRQTDIHRHNTRQINQYLTCRPRHVFAKKCLRFNISHLKNNSPSNIINKITTHSLYGSAFHIKLHFLNKYSDICRNTNCYVCNNV